MNKKTTSYFSVRNNISPNETEAANNKKTHIYITTYAIRKPFNTN